MKELDLNQQGLKSLWSTTSILFAASIGVLYQVLKTVNLQPPISGQVGLKLGSYCGAVSMSPCQLSGGTDV